MSYYDFYFVPANGVTDLNPCELDYLKGLLLGSPFSFYIEVGVGQLGTIYELARAISDAGVGCRCIGLDAFGRLPADSGGNNSHQGDVVRFDEANSFFADSKLDHIVSLHRGDSSALLGEILPDIESRRKLIFIDANHTYEGCLADFRAVDGHVIPGDAVVFHDTLRFQHPDYGRGPRGVVEDHVMGDKRYRMLRFPAPDIVMSTEANTIGAFEVV